MSDLLSSGRAYAGYSLWAKVYDKRVLTEEGIYSDGLVHPEYAGPELTIEFSQLLIFANRSGKFLEYRVMEYDEVMDDERQKGIGVMYTMEGVEYNILPVGPSVAVALWEVKYHPTNFTTAESARISQLYRSYVLARQG